MKVQNELKSLSLAGFSSIVQCLRVRPEPTWGAPVKGRLQEKPAKDEHSSLLKNYGHGKFCNIGPWPSHPFPVTHERTSLSWSVFPLGWSVFFYWSYLEIIVTVRQLENEVGLKGATTLGRLALGRTTLDGTARFKRCKIPTSPFS